jgi:hypothetical protein
VYGGSTLELDSLLCVAGCTGHGLLLENALWFTRIGVTVWLRLYTRETLSARAWGNRRVWRARERTRRLER